MNESQDSPPLYPADLEQASLGDTEFEKEILSEFLSSSDGMLSSLEGAAASSDAQQLHRAAHSLKGCCWTVGARAMGAECEKLELEARDGGIERALERVQRIQQLFRQVEDYVRSRWSV